nr:hypothetical protein [Phyllobacterium phragmitis]
MTKKPVGLAHFLNLPVSHDKNPIAQFGYDAEIMRDKKHAHAALPDGFSQQVKNAGLYRDVERRGRLIGDKQPGAGCHCTGNDDPLALTAGKLMRITVENTCRIRKTGLRQQLFGLRAACPPQGKLAAYPHKRVECAHRILKNHGNIASAQPGAGRPVGQVIIPTIKHHAPRTGRLIGQKPDQSTARHGFPRPGFADDTEDFTPAKGKIHALNYIGPTKRDP